MYKKPTYFVYYYVMYYIMSCDSGILLYRNKLYENKISNSSLNCTFHSIGFKFKVDSNCKVLMETSYIEDYKLPAIKWKTSCDPIPAVFLDGICIFSIETVK